MRYPLQAELTYRRLLYEVVSAVHREFRTELEAEGRTIVAQANESRADDFTNVLDYANRITALTNRVGEKLKTGLRYSIFELERVANEVVQTSRREWQRILMASYKQNFIRPEGWLPSALSGWRTRNSDLVMDLSEETVRRVKDRIMETMRANPTMTGVRESLSQSVAAAYKRADNIARDQTAKLNSNLNEQRQAEFGVRKYRWRTMADELVRSSHALNEGKLCSWVSPPANTGHPGHDPNCRCYAEPVMPPTGILV